MLGYTERSCSTVQGYSANPDPTFTTLRVSYRWTQAMLAVLLRTCLHITSH